MEALRRTLSSSPRPQRHEPESVFCRPSAVEQVPGLPLIGVTHTVEPVQAFPFRGVGSGTGHFPYLLLFTSLDPVLLDFSFLSRKIFGWVDTCRGHSIASLRRKFCCFRRPSSRLHTVCLMNFYRSFLRSP